MVNDLANLSRRRLVIGISFSLKVETHVHMDFFSTENIVSLLTLTFLEIVLGIDNIVFISLVSGRLPASQQRKAQLIGIGLAFLGRIILLLTITWIIGLSKPFLHFNDFALSYRDLILIAGGLFLVGKSTSEIHKRMEGAEHNKAPKKLSMGSALIQILILDVVFSLDSIITAIGLSDVLLTMIIAIVVALGIMLLFMKHVSEFIQKHPAMKILAISFLMMIGTVLVIEGLHVHVPKGYIYVSMAFALGIEFLNMWIRKKAPDPVVEESAVKGNTGSKGNKRLKVVGRR
jgi:predicted tellurium resistance membrane protein TerC